MSEFPLDRHRRRVTNESAQREFEALIADRLCETFNRQLDLWVEGMPLAWVYAPADDPTRA